ncbi:MAG: type II secretion system protein [Clostridiales bacterium]|nr:type II secretion system protein [Clostridiales bacterium]
MKKTAKRSKKGFTLVELIVVLVILAVLAAMLVPALVGYVDKAKAEKEYQTAATVYGAAQATVTEMYGRDAISKGGTLTQATSKGYGSQVLTLAGVDKNAVSKFSFAYGDDFVITGGSVTINKHEYKLTITNGVPKWEAS